MIFQIDAVTSEKWKYEKMRDRSVRCALWMKAQGLLSEDVVMICSHNQMDVAMAAFGALYLGAIFNPLDVGLHLSEFFSTIMLQRIRKKRKPGPS